ncbi:EcsC protein family protein [Microlunatus sagamiharensis]|uniref:EcsC protein family protein n=1 Tax=Microlunatus sagamiharensis TaxID=546874 RepID=A0A1H2NB98_9ACTN|nr:EcsC family protein [Microlunatus sagamiharensis]SDV02461.1 EcsC protein family protein [Microlunatus sagamiharensis]
MPTAQEVGRAIARGIAPVARSVSPGAAGGALRRVLELAIDGPGRLPGARTVAAKHLQRHGGSVDDAIDSLVAHHVRLASAQGFVTNLGGLAALPVAIPANLTGVAVVQVRMVAAVAHLRGYDVNDLRVRTALVMCLLGGDEVAKRIGDGSLPTSPMAVATAPVFDAALDRQVAEAVLADLMSRIGGKNLALVVTRRVPLLGGGVGAVVDGMATHQIGAYAKAELLRRRALSH